MTKLFESLELAIRPIHEHIRPRLDIGDFGIHACHVVGGGIPHIEDLGRYDGSFQHVFRLEKRIERGKVRLSLCFSQLDRKSVV